MYVSLDGVALLRMDDYEPYFETLKGAHCERFEIEEI
jgi:hypothetical protein